MADSLLSPTVGLTCSAAAAGILVYSARKFAAEPGHDEKIPLAGVLGAFVFAGQMLNFAVPGTGSSGHIGGGLLLAALLGPYAAFLTIAAVLVIQCLFFQDGGILALGCNVLNLGLWPCLLGLPLFRLLRGAQPASWRHSMAAVAAVVVGLELGAFGVVVETVLSGRTELPFKAFAPLMAGIHLPIAICEGVMTAMVLRFVERVRPGVAVYMQENACRQNGNGSARVVLVTLALCALLMAGVFSWFASDKPDGLEWSMGKVAGTEELERPASGWVARTQQWVSHLAIFPDYQWKAGGKPGGAEPAMAEVDGGGKESAGGSLVNPGGSAAGIVGALATGLLVTCVCGVLWLVCRKRGVVTKTLSLLLVLLVMTGATVDAGEGEQHLDTAGKHRVDGCDGIRHPLSQVEFEVSSDFASKYVSRGVAINDEPVLQPRARVCWEGLELSVWGNYDLTGFNGRRNQFQEVDYTVSYSRAFNELGALKTLTLSGGIIFYEFPGTAAPTQELFLTASLDDLFLTPTLTAYYDFNKGDALYLNPTIEHTLATPWERAELTLKGGLGWGDANLNHFNMGMAQPHAGFMEVTLSATLGIKIAEGITCGPFIAWSGVPDSRIRAAAKAQDRDGHSSHAWCGFGVSATF